MPAPAKEGKVVEGQPRPCRRAPASAPQTSQTKEPIASPMPATEGQAAPGQTTTPAAAAKGYNGKVVDAQTKAPIAGALVTLGDQQVRADKDGVFHLEGAGETLKLRYPGYARRELRHLGADRAHYRNRPHPLHGEGALSFLLWARQQANPRGGQRSH